MRTLPPLNAVKAFEAAARLGSFTKAGTELKVTHGAVSRQVALLEEWLGQPLFQRNQSHLHLTPEGQRFAQALGTALDRIETAALEMSEASAQRVLRVNAPPTFALRWLIPRLSTFRHRHRDIDVRLTTSLAPLDTGFASYDIAVRGYSQPVPGIDAHPFLSYTIVAVCHPDLKEAGPLEQPADLARHTLLTHATSLFNWDNWFAAVHSEPVRPVSIQAFEQLYFAIQAALEGMGVALVPYFLVVDDIAAGRLCIPFERLGVTTRDYYLNRALAARPDPASDAFVAWIKAEGVETMRLYADLLDE